MILKTESVIGGCLFLEHLSFQKNFKTKNQPKLRETQEERLCRVPGPGWQLVMCSLIKSLSTTRDRLVAPPP